MHVSPRLFVAGTLLALVLALTSVMWVTNVWQPWIPDCARGDPGTCLMYPDGSLR